jgi:hypothetical protein
VTNFAHNGVRCRGSRGCATSLPYWCPADHVLRMHYLAGVMPQTPQVPLRVREHSVLRHPLAPTAAQRVLFVDVDGPFARKCVNCADDEGAYLSRAAGEAAKAAAGARSARAVAAAQTVSTHALTAARAAGAPSLHVPGGVWSEDEVRKRLGEGEAAKAALLHVSSLRADGGLGARLDGARAHAFVESMKPLGGGWCCVEVEKRGGFGHYWYDALWDVPHTDRHGRTWTRDRPYVPTAGP